MSNFNTLISWLGYAMAVVGVGLNWGVGSALMLGGIVLFVAGGLASSRERA